MSLFLHAHCWWCRFNHLSFILVWDLLICFKLVHVVHIVLGLSMLNVTAISFPLTCLCGIPEVFCSCSSSLYHQPMGFSNRPKIHSVQSHLPLWSSPGAVCEIHTQLIYKFGFHADNVVTGCCYYCGKWVIGSFMLLAVSCVSDGCWQVNVLEPHPHLPLLATSGLDSDIKLWMPTASQPANMSTLQRASDTSCLVLRTVSVLLGSAPGPTLGKRVWENFTFLQYASSVMIISHLSCTDICTHIMVASWKTDP